MRHRVDRGEVEGRIRKRSPGGNKPEGYRVLSQPTNRLNKLVAAEPTVHTGSGPVGGVVGTNTLGKQLGKRNLLSVDMGGTTLDVSLIKNNEYLREARSWFGRFLTGQVENQKMKLQRYYCPSCQTCIKTEILADC